MRAACFLVSTLGVVGLSVLAVNRKCNFLKELRTNYRLVPVAGVVGIRYIIVETARLTGFERKRGVQTRDIS